MERVHQRRPCYPAALIAAAFLCWAAQSEGAPLMVHAPGAARSAVPAAAVPQRHQAPVQRMQSPAKPLNLGPSGAASLQRVTVHWTVPDQGAGRVIQHWEVRACPKVQGNPYVACLPVLEPAAGQTSGATVQAQVPSHVAYLGRSTPVNATEVCSVNPVGTSCADRLALRFPNPAVAPAPMRGMAALGGIASRGAPSSPGPRRGMAMAPGAHAPGIGIAPSGGIGIARGFAPQTVKVRSGTRLSAMLALPDSTMLEGPHGQRMTVAAFKQRRMQIMNGIRARHGLSSAHGKTMRVAFSQRGQGIARKIAAYRANEIAAAKRVMASPAFNRGGKMPAERTQSAQLGNRFTRKTQFATCVLQSNGIASVNGRTHGVIFTPGGSYAIQGCGFGDRPGKAYVVGSSTNLGNVAVQVPLLVQSQDWSNQAIHATIDAGISGLGDISKATLVVQPASGASLQQGGHQFYAARETRPFVLPKQYIEFNASSDWVVRYDHRSGSVNRGYCTGSDSCQWVFPDGPKGRTGRYCAAWPGRAKDVWRLDEVASRLKRSGFEIDYRSIAIQNTTPYAGDNFTWDRHNGAIYEDAQGRDLGSFSARERNNDLYVQFQGHSVYNGDFLFGVATDTHSVCYSSYSVSVSVSGPRGVPMPNL